MGGMLGRGIDYADLYFQYTRQEGWSLEDGAVKSGSRSTDQGVGLRAVSGEKTGFAYSGRICFACVGAGRRCCEGNRSLGRYVGAGY